MLSAMNKNNCRTKRHREEERKKGRNKFNKWSNMAHKLLRIKWQHIKYMTRSKTDLSLSLQILPRDIFELVD